MVLEGPPRKRGEGGGFDEVPAVLQGCLLKEKCFSMNGDACGGNFGETASVSLGRRGEKESYQYLEQLFSSLGRSQSGRDGRARQIDRPESPLSPLHLPTPQRSQKGVGTFL